MKNLRDTVFDKEWWDRISNVISIGMRKPRDSEDVQRTTALMCAEIATEVNYATYKSLGSS